MKAYLEIPYEPSWTDSFVIELEEDDLLGLLEQLSDEEIEKLVELLKRRREYAEFSSACE